jgi:hypothetical protein
VKIQLRDRDFEFRTGFSQKLQEENHFSLTNEQVLEKNAAKLKVKELAKPRLTEDSNFLGLHAWIPLLCKDAS